MPNGGMPNGENDVLRAECRTALGEKNPNGRNAEWAECRKRATATSKFCLLCARISEFLSFVISCYYTSIPEVFLLIFNERKMMTMLFGSGGDLLHRGEFIICTTEDLSQRERDLHGDGDIFIMGRIFTISTMSLPGGFITGRHNSVTPAIGNRQTDKQIKISPFIM